jgi:hypothetical protein
MENKTSFYLHNDMLNVLDKLTDEQAGKLFKAIKNYQHGIEDELDLLLEITFMPFKNQFDRDMVKYQGVVERNKENGKKGGRPKKTQDNPKETQKNPKNPSGFLNNPEKPKETLKDKDKESDKENDSVNDIDDDTLINSVSTIIGTHAFRSDVNTIKGKILFQNGNLDDKINSIVGYYVDTFGKTPMTLDEIKNKLKQLQLN